MENAKTENAKTESNWYWFGVLVNSDWHVHLRQVHVFRQDSRWVIEQWSKGAHGGLWYCSGIGSDRSRVGAVLKAYAWIKEHCQGYATIDQGKSEWTSNREERQQARQSAGGTQQGDWWAEVLGVDTGAGWGEIRGAFLAKAKVVHPDVRPSDEVERANEEMKRLNAAFAYAKERMGK